VSADAATPTGEQSLLRPIILPLLPLKNTVLFPYLFVPLSVGRPQSVAAVEQALASEEKTLICVAERNGAAEQLRPEDLYRVGVRGVIKKMARGEEGLELLVQGIERVRIEAINVTESRLMATATSLPLPVDEGAEVDALHRSIIEQANKAVMIAQPQAQGGFQQMIASTPDPLRLAYLLGSMLSLDTAKEQSLLEAATRHEALTLLHGYMLHEVQVLELRQKIASQAQTEMSREQREYLLRQQMRAIQDELGEKSPEKAEVEGLRQRLTEADLPDEVRKDAERDLTRLERIPAAAPDHQVIRSHLELILELPWRKGTTDDLDLTKTRTILDEDQYDLADV